MAVVVAVAWAGATEAVGVLLPCCAAAGRTAAVEDVTRGRLLLKTLQGGWRGRVGVLLLSLCE